MPKKLIIHPGLGKTATTTIQSMAAKISMESSANFSFCPFGIVGGAHNGYAKNHPLYDDRGFGVLIRETIEYVLKSSKPVFISSEFLIRQNPSDSMDFVDLFLKENISIEVFVGIRNYPDLLLSSYMQALKVRYGMLHKETFVQYIEREFPLMRIPSLIEPWCKLIGKNNIVIFDYDLDKKKFVERFFSYLGFNGSVVLNGLVHENLSIPYEAMDLICAFDAVSNDGIRRDELLNLLIRTDYLESAKEKYKSIAHERLMGLYLNDYSYLSENYKIL